MMQYDDAQFEQRKNKLMVGLHGATWRCIAYLLQASCPTAANGLDHVLTPLERPKGARSPIGILCHHAEVLIFDPLPIPLGGLRSTRACIKRHRTPCFDQSLIFQDRVVLRSLAFPSFCLRLLIRFRFDLLQFFLTTMIVHAALRFIVVECGERGLINVNGVGVQQVHELDSCIVRTTAIVNDNKSRATANGEKQRKLKGRRGIPSGHLVKHLACSGSSAVERHRRGTSCKGRGGG